MRKKISGLWEKGGRLLAGVRGRRFLVSGLSAVVMLAVLMGIWNYFILPNSLLGGPRVEVEQQQDANPAAPADSQKQTAGETATPSDEGEANTAERGTTIPEGPILPAEPDLTAMQTPLEGPVVKAFGFTYSPTFEDYRYHSGVDLAAPEGAAVSAVLAGVVSSVSHDSQEGYRVTVDHGGQWQSVYSELASAAVEKGQELSRGAFIGRIGAPGSSETTLGCHLHLEFQHDGTALDPALYLDLKQAVQ